MLMLDPNSTARFQMKSKCLQNYLLPPNLLFLHHYSNRYLQFLAHLKNTQKFFMHIHTSTYIKTYMFILFDSYTQLHHIHTVLSSLLNPVSWTSLSTGTIYLMLFNGNIVFHCIRRLVTSDLLMKKDLILNCIF